MRKLLALLPGFIILCVQLSFSQYTDFSQDNAAAILKTLAVEIGKRPMGSPAEQKALQFAVDKFKLNGCDSSYVLPMTVASGVNTTSGVAVGVKKGSSSRIIVIGGHIDTVPDAPGANDDGSGIACVIELARVLCKRDNLSTIYFCCWGGEEQGLEGSKFFVDHFPEIDSVALMLQIDMTDGAGVLNADPDGSKTSAPFWLVDATFNIFYNELPHSGLVYPTEDATWNLATGGSWGSDHIPFIDKGIPAIDFTSDPTFPIHTPQDSWENFTLSGLKRSGDLVLKLVEKFDGGVPSRTTERYQLVKIGNRVFPISYGALWLFIGLGIGSLIVAFIAVRKRRSSDESVATVKWSRIKLVFATIVIQAFIWTSETLVGFVKGYRFPWANNVVGFRFFGLLCGAVGVWFVLRAERKYRLSRDASIFARLSLVAFLVMTVVTSYMTPELGMFLAAVSMAFAAAIISRRPVVKLTFFVLAFMIFYRLLFFDGIVLFQRIIALNNISKWWQNALVDCGYILLFTVFSLPFVSGFAAIYRGSGTDLLWLKQFRGTRGLLAALLASLGAAVYLFAQPVYDRLWYSSMRVEQLYTLGDDSSSVTIKGSEYVRGLSGHLDGRDTVFAEDENNVPIVSPRASMVTWASVSKAVQSVGLADSTWKVERSIVVRSQFRPLRIDVVYESDQPFEISSPWSYGVRTPGSPVRSEKQKRFRWAYYPDTVVAIPVTFALRDSQRIAERIEVAFDSIAYPLQLQRAFTNVGYRTLVTAKDTFSVSK